MSRRPLRWIRTLLGFGHRLVVRAVAIGAVLALGQYVLSADNRKQHAALRESVEETRKLNSELGARNAQLRLQVQAIQHDDRYLEQVARQELGMVKADELIYTFMN